MAECCDLQCLMYIIDIVGDKFSSGIKMYIIIKGQCNFELKI